MLFSQGKTSSSTHDGVRCDAVRICKKKSKETRVEWVRERIYSNWGYFSTTEIGLLFDFCRFLFFSTLFTLFKLMKETQKNEPRSKSVFHSALFSLPFFFFLFLFIYLQLANARYELVKFFFSLVIVEPACLKLTVIK